MHSTNKQIVSSTNTSCRRCIAYSVAIYILFVAVVVITGNAVIPIVLPVLPSVEVAPAPGSIYIPGTSPTGAGFAGFWYHFGYFSQQHQSGNKTFQRKNASQASHGDIHNEMVNNNNNTYYCYSSGCLGYVLAAASVNVETVLTAAQRVQSLWLKGQIHRYDVVPHFLQEVLPPALDAPVSSLLRTNETVSATTSTTSRWDSMLSPLRIIVTVMESKSILNSQLMRHRVHSPTSYSSLVQFLQQTTHIPWLTGPITMDGADEVIIDGGFSRILHPLCATQIVVPATWSTMIHSLNPGLDPKDAKELYYHGMTDANRRNAHQESPTPNNFRYEILQHDMSR